MKIFIELDTDNAADNERLLLLAQGLNGIAIEGMTPMSAGEALRHSAIDIVGHTVQPADILPVSVKPDDSELDAAVVAHPGALVLSVADTAHTHPGAAVADVAVISEERPPNKRGGRKTKEQKALEEAGVAEIRAAEKAAMMEAISNLSPRQTPTPEPPPPPILPKLILPGNLPLPPPRPPITQQTPALPGSEPMMPFIPPDGESMALADLMTVVRLSSQVGVGIAFEVMRKHRMLNPKDVPENFRAQLAREIATAAKLI